MALRADVADLQTRSLVSSRWMFRLYCVGILRPQVRLELSEEQDRTVERPVHGLSARRIQECR